MFQRTLRKRTWQIGRKNEPIGMTESLQDLSITVKVLALEEVSLSDKHNAKTVS